MGSFFVEVPIENLDSLDAPVLGAAVLGSDTLFFVFACGDFGAAIALDDLLGGDTACWAAGDSCGDFLVGDCGGSGGAVEAGGGGSLGDGCWSVGAWAAGGAAPGANGAPGLACSSSGGDVGLDSALAAVALLVGRCTATAAALVVGAWAAGGAALAANGAPGSAFEILRDHREAAVLPTSFVRLASSAVSLAAASSAAAELAVAEPQDGPSTIAAGSDAENVFLNSCNSSMRPSVPTTGPEANNLLTTSDNCLSVVSRWVRVAV